MECGILDSMMSMWLSHVIMVLVSATVAAVFMWWFLTRSRKREQMAYQPLVRGRR